MKYCKTTLDSTTLLSLTATMRALLSSEDFTFDCDTTVYNPATMTKAQWLVVIRLLWSSFKDKLSYNRQTEYQHARSLYPAARHKPYSGKVVKASSGPDTSMTAAASVAKAPSIPGRIAVAVTPVRTNAVKTSGAWSLLRHHQEQRRWNLGWQYALVIWQSSTMSR